jgi:hypothetical protein
VFGLFVTGLLQQARAQVVFDLGTFIVPSEDPNAATKSLAIPAGKYNAYSLTTDWSEVGVDPWSEEAIWAISDGPLYEANTTMFVDPGSAPNSQRNNNPITLEWNGLLDLPLTGPFDASLLMLQAYDEPEGSFAARWANTVLELSYVTPPAPPDLTADLGVVATPFAPFVIDTFASDFDTDLGVYSETGAIVMQNDDAGGMVQSEVDLYNGLPAGDYIAAIGGFNTIFDDVYEVIPGDAGGDYGLNVAGHQFEGTLAASEVAYVGFSISDVASAGDFDKDGDVDGDDFLAWQGGFGTASGALKSDGDYDNDGDVDGDDFLGWQDEFGSPGEGGSQGAVQGVPEPNSIMLLAAGAVGLGMWRRRRAG